MTGVYSAPGADLDVLRLLCEFQGVSPQAADLEAVSGFLAVILPALAEIERSLPADTPLAP